MQLTSASPRQSILFIINVQHDCEAATCSLASSHAVRQEREDTGLLQTAVAHNLTRRQYLLNTHALHNAALLRRHLPRSLLKPQALYEDREKRHHELARVLRVTQVAKRAETQKKRAETLLKKAQKNATGAGLTTAAGGSRTRATGPGTGEFPIQRPCEVLF